VISNTSATITYNDDETFGSFSSHMENSFPGGIFDNLIFNPVGNVEASGGQSGNSTSLIWLTIKAAPGYALTGVGFSENGSWATGNFGSVGVVAQGGIVDTATGIPLSPNPILVSKDTAISGSSLAAGNWSMSNSFLADPNAPGPNEITIAVARTLSANGGYSGFGSALIGNTQFGFGSGTGLNIFYTAQLIPEPATYLISALGFVLLIAVKLKRQ
jgi:hypothetical protein